MSIQINMTMTNWKAKLWGGRTHVIVSLILLELKLMLFKV